MKQVIAGLLAMCFLSSCASSSEHIYLKRANCKISANIIKFAEGYKLEMVFENKSETSVRLQNPECINQNVIISVYSGDGEEALKHAPEISETCREFITLEPRAKRSFVIPNTLNSMYELKTDRNYTVYVEYIGGFYEEGGGMYGDMIVKSPAVEFAVK